MFMFGADYLNIDKLAETGRDMAICMWGRARLESSGIKDNG